MLNITTLNAQGVSGDGFAVLAYLKATEYYVDKEGQSVASSVWMGQGAAELGLSGAVDIDVMDKLAKGFAPDGTPLVQNAGEQGELRQQKDPAGRLMTDEDGNPVMERVGGRRVGYDFTLSPPQGVSTLMALADDAERDRIIAAHQTAVAKVMSWAEEMAETRTGKAGLEAMDVRGLVMSQHTHFGSRELDPQLHSHVLVYNIAKGEDGQWRTLEPENLFRHMRDLGAYYRAALAEEVQKLGYGIEVDRERDIEGRETGDVFFRIAGIDQALDDRFSKRRQQVLDYVEEHGGTKQDAALASRKHKDEPPFRELVAHWKRELADHERTHGRLPTLDELKKQPSRVLQDVSDQATLERLHTSDAMWSMGAAVGRLALEKVGQVSADRLFDEARQLIQRTGCVDVAPESRIEYAKSAKKPKRYAESRYAASWMLDAEKECVASAKARQDDLTTRVAPETLKKAVEEFEAKKGFKLTDEQRTNIQHVATGTGGVAIVEGRAGTGKTTVSAVWIDAFQREGWDVVGCAIGWKAAKKLEAESGIRSLSTSALVSMLDRQEQEAKQGKGPRPGDVVLGPKSVLVLDEAGMADTRTIQRLQHHVDRAGGKLVLQGDAIQLQPIGAGAAFRLLGEAVGKATLADIRRQKSKEDRQVAADFYQATEDLAPGQRLRRNERAMSSDMFETLVKREMVVAFAKRDQAIKGLVTDFMGDKAELTEKLILAGDNRDCRMLNAEVRKQRRERGELEGEDVKLNCIVGRHEETLAFAVHDRIRFTGKDAGLGVVNNSEAVITGLTKGENGWVVRAKLQSDIDSEHGREVTFNTDEFRKFTHAYAMTVHKSQGQGKAAVYQLASPTMTDLHSSLVGFTRMKERYKLFGTALDLESVQSRMMRERLKSNILDGHFGNKSTPEKARDTAPRRDTGFQPGKPKRGLSR